MVLRFPRVLLAALVGVLSCVLGFAPAAHAGTSASGLAANAWIVSDLAGQALTAIPQSGEVSAYEANLARTATVGTTAAAGVQAIPKGGSKLGMIINTVAVLGGLALTFLGGDDAPDLPGVLAGTPETYGSQDCGMWSGAFITGVTCRATSPFTSTVAVGTIPEARAGLYIASSPDRAPGWVAWASSPVSFNGGISRSSAGPVRFEIRGCASITACEAGTWTLRGTGTVAVIGGTVAPQPTSDPALVPRYIDSQINCKSAGGAVQNLTRTDGPFYVDPSVPTTSPEVPDMVCPEGTWLESGGRDLRSDGTTETVPLVEPYAAPEWVGQQATQFPECFPVGATQCQLELFKLATTKHSEYPCHAYPIGAENPCMDWWTDPDRATRYQCRFGGTAVKMKRCQPYATTFTNGTTTATPADPDADLDVPVVEVDPTPEQTPNDTGCVPKWGDLLSPWWVYKASVCALKWAFIPETSLAVRMQRLSTDISTRVPFSWFAGFGAIPAAVPSDGCPDWEIKIPGQLDKNVVCGSSYTEMIRSARPVLAVFMGALALWPLIRSTAYAAFPIIKPQPGTLR